MGSGSVADCTCIGSLRSRVGFIVKEPASGGDVEVYLAVVFNVGDEEPLPTETPPSVTETPPGPTATSEPPTTTPTATTEPPPEYDVICDQEYEIEVTDEELHFKFAATACEDGVPLEDVDLKGTLDTGSQTPSNIEETKFNGVADFTILRY